MEFLLLWLDDLDDLLFAFLHSWERLRQYCLAVSLAAALALHGFRWSEIQLAPDIAYINVSILGIVAWSLMSLVCHVVDQRAARVSITA